MSLIDPFSDGVEQEEKLELLPQCLLLTLEFAGFTIKCLPSYFAILDNLHVAKASIQNPMDEITEGPHSVGSKSRLEYIDNIDFCTE